MPNGRAADGTYAAGVRRTFELTAEDAWTNWGGPEGLQRWLGRAKKSLEEGAETVLADGTRVKAIRVRPPSHLRIRLEREDWSQARTAQLRVLRAARGVTIALHAEGLPDAATRADLIERWTQALAGGAAAPVKKAATRRKTASKASAWKPAATTKPTRKAPVRKARSAESADRKSAKTAAATTKSQGRAATRKASARRAR